MSEQKQATHSPTEIANYIRLDSCPKYLKFLADKKETIKPIQKEYRDLDEDAIDKYYEKQGEKHEEEFKNAQIKLGLTDVVSTDFFIHCPQDNFFATEVPIVGEIEGITISGRIDFLIKVNGQLIIVECKASRADKTYQRAQAAIYALLLSEKLGEQGPKIAQVLVARRKAKTDEIQTFKLDGQRFILDPESQNEEADDEQGNLPSPTIDQAELEALQEDIRSICRKLKDDPSNAQARFAPRCQSCPFNAECLEEAITSLSHKSNGTHPLLNTKHKKYFESKGGPDLVELSKLRQSYYKKAQQEKNVGGTANCQPGKFQDGVDLIRLDNRFPNIPRPTENSLGLVQFFISAETNPTENNQLWAVGVLCQIVSFANDKHHVENINSPELNDDENNPITFLTNEVNTILKLHTDSKFHFYFWSHREKRLIIEALTDKCESGGSDKYKTLLNLLSLHKSLREPDDYKYAWDEGNTRQTLQFVDTEEEHMVTCLEEEVSKCYALGCVGNSLIEVASLNWDKSGPLCDPENILHLMHPSQKVGNKAKLNRTIRYSDSISPSHWIPKNRKIKKDIKDYVEHKAQALQKIEHKLAGFIDKGSDKLWEEKRTYREIAKDNTLDEDLIKSSRNMLLIEAIHNKEEWLREVTLHLDEMMRKGRAVKLAAPPKWNTYANLCKDCSKCNSGGRCATIDICEKPSYTIEINLYIDLKGYPILDAISKFKERLKLTKHTKLLRLSNKKTNIIDIEGNSLPTSIINWRFNNDRTHIYCENRNNKEHKSIPTAQDGYNYIVSNNCILIQTNIPKDPRTPHLDYPSCDHREGAGRKIENLKNRKDRIQQPKTKKSSQHVQTEVFKNVSNQDTYYLLADCKSINTLQQLDNLKDLKNVRGSNSFLETILNLR